MHAPCYKHQSQDSNQGSLGPLTMLSLQAPQTEKSWAFLAFSHSQPAEFLAHLLPLQLLKCFPPHPSCLKSQLFLGIPSQAELRDSRAADREVRRRLASRELAGPRGRGWEGLQVAEDLMWLNGRCVMRKE